MFANFTAVYLAFYVVISIRVKKMLLQID